MYPFGHIDLRVHDAEVAYSFYSKILPDLGFRNEWRGEEAFSFQAEGEFPRLSWFGMLSKIAIMSPILRGLPLQLRAPKKLIVWLQLFDPLGP